MGHGRVFIRVRFTAQLSVAEYSNLSQIYGPCCAKDTCMYQKKLNHIQQPDMYRS